MILMILIANNDRILRVKLDPRRSPGSISFLWKRTCYAVDKPGERVSVADGFRKGGYGSLLEAASCQ